MTIDALPELVQMMNDIQEALAEPESSAGPEPATMEIEHVEGRNTCSCMGIGPAVPEGLQSFSCLP